MRCNYHKKRFCILLAGSCVFFFGLLLMFGVDVYNDSQQYITMNIRRDPGYPLFLWMLRCISPTYYLILAGILQSAFAAWCSADFTEYITEAFRLKRISTAIIFIITLIPHIITPMFSVSRFVISTGIMSEALCLPLFLLFIKEMHKSCVSEDKKAALTSLGMGVLLSMIRAQLSSVLILWLIVMAVRVIVNRQYKKIVIYVLAVVLCFGAKTLLTKTYNLAVQGHFINTTYGPVNILTNILYASDREQGEGIDDQELREIFYMLYDEMDEKQYHYQDASDGIFKKAQHLESIHDRLKFEVCDSKLNEYIEKLGITEYISENLYVDQYAAALVKELLPGCFARWGMNYLMLGIRGAIRSIAVVHPVLSIYALIMGTAAVVMTIRSFIRDRESKEAWLMLIALLSVAGIAYSTALTIMCLSRYMVYSFAGFYTAAYLMLLTCKKNITGKENNNGI